MPISGGTAGAHDDAMHQGSAKRDVLYGVAGLDNYGRVRGIEYGFIVGRTSSEVFSIYERTSGEIVQQWHRLGLNDYIGSLMVGGSLEQILDDSMKDVVSGIAALDAGGAVLAPGSEVKLTRDGSENIEVVERTSGDIVYRWTRIGANDYECRINCGGVACIIQNDSMKDIAGGIAGLDADVLLSPALLPPCLEEYSNHLGATDNFTQTAVAGNGAVNPDAANHEMDLSTGVGAVGHALFESKETYALSSQPLVANFLIQNIIDGVAATRYTHIGLKDDFTVSAFSTGVYFRQLDDNSWEIGGYTGGVGGGAAITALANGDVCTIVAGPASSNFFVNGVHVGTRTVNISAANLKLGAAVYAAVNTVSTARCVSIDMMGVKRWY